jgi:XTP/dITP diphosphohydrolase
MTFELVLGTNNAKKLREMKMLLTDTDVAVKSLAEIENSIEVDETGSSFEENAQLKASEQARHLNAWVLGEDSGLSVAALDGAPGIYSARFSGADATDDQNNTLLLEKLSGVPAGKRSAWYTSHMALSDPQGNVRISCEARCYGRILDKPIGDGGFGYDPLFELVEYHQTFAQLGDAVKSMLSHRARANRKFLPQFTTLLATV